MDFSLSEEQQLLLETIRKMGERENFRELAAQIDTTGEFPHHLAKTFADVGLLGMSISQEYGGGRTTIFKCNTGN